MEDDKLEMTEQAKEFSNPTMEAHSFEFPEFATEKDRQASLILPSLICEHSDTDFLETDERIIRKSPSFEILQTQYVFDSAFRGSHIDNGEFFSGENSGI